MYYYIQNKLLDKKNVPFLILKRNLMIYRQRNVIYLKFWYISFIYKNISYLRTRFERNQSIGTFHQNFIFLFRRYSSGRIVLLEIEWREVSYFLLYLFCKNSIFRPTSVRRHHQELDTEILRPLYSIKVEMLWRQWYNFNV